MLVHIFQDYDIQNLKKHVDKFTATLTKPPHSILQSQSPIANPKYDALDQYKRLLPKEVTLVTITICCE